VSAGRDTLELTSLDQVAALVHPIRRRILAELAEPASPAEVGRRLGLASQLANYHVRALEQAGLAERVETRQRRNLLEHRFRSVARSFALSAALPLSDEQRRSLQQDVVLQQLVKTSDSLRADALALLEGAHADRHLATMSLEVELRDGAERAAFVRALMDAVRRAAEPFRATDTGAAGIRVRAGARQPPPAAHQRSDEASREASHGPSRMSQVSAEASRRSQASAEASRQAYRVQLAIYPTPDRGR